MFFVHQFASLVHVSPVEVITLSLLINYLHNQLEEGTIGLTTCISIVTLEGLTREGMPDHAFAISTLLAERPLATALVTGQSMPKLTLKHFSSCRKLQFHVKLWRGTMYD